MKRYATYKGKPTKWTMLRWFYQLERRWWNLRRFQQILLLENRMSSPDYIYEYNLNTYPNVKWIREKVQNALSHSDPVEYFDRINIRLFLQNIQLYFEHLTRAESYTEWQAGLPLAETVGSKMNPFLNLSKEDLQRLIENETGVIYTEEQLNY